MVLAANWLLQVSLDIDGTRIQFQFQKALSALFLLQFFTNQSFTAVPLKEMY